MTPEELARFKASIKMIKEHDQALSDLLGREAGAPNWVSDIRIGKAEEFLLSVFKDGQWHSMTGLQALAAKHWHDWADVKEARKGLPLQHKRKPAWGIIWWRLKPGTRERAVSMPEPIDYHALIRELTPRQLLLDLLWDGRAVALNRIELMARRHNCRPWSAVEYAALTLGVQEKVKYVSGRGEGGKLVKSRIVEAWYLKERVE